MMLSPQMHHVEQLQVPCASEHHVQLMSASCASELHAASFVQKNETKKGERHLSRSPIVLIIH